MTWIIEQMEASPVVCQLSIIGSTSTPFTEVTSKPEMPSATKTTKRAARRLAYIVKDLHGVPSPIKIKASKKPEIQEVRALGGLAVSLELSPSFDGMDCTVSHISDC